MKKIILLLLISFSISSFGQIENRWQPDSIYLNKKVKKIYVFLNSPKDLSEIVEFNSDGKRMRLTKYSASYNRRTRKSKSIDKISYYDYDSKGLLNRIIDSVGVDSTNFRYNNEDKLIYSRKNLGNFEYETHYKYEPYKTITTQKKDSAVIYHKTKEYDRDFYINRFYGYVLEPKLKMGFATTESDTLKYQYSDYDDLERFEDNKVIKNEFNQDNQLIESKIKSVFMNDRVNEYNLYYNYYKNGLLKSVGGYVPRYFKYEFWE